MTAWTLDVAKLATAFDAVRTFKGLSERGAAAELGISPSTINRLKKGHPPNADTVTSLVMWLRADLRDFARPAEPGPAPEEDPT